MRGEVSQGRHGSDAVHVSGKSIVVRGVDVSIELTLHLENRCIVRGNPTKFQTPPMATKLCQKSLGVM